MQNCILQRGKNNSPMEMKFLFSQKYLPHFFAVITLCALLIVSEYFFHLNVQHQHGLQHSEVFNQAATVRLNIEREINTTLNLSTGLVLFVSINPTFTESEFVGIAKELLNKAPNLRNIALAKDNVINHIYPFEGNEKALGLRYMDHPEQKEAVVRAIKLKDTVIAGPVNLKQGGEGFISRIPIFLAGSEDSYWGLASIVINVGDFYKSCGLSEHDARVKYALRGKDGLGENGAVFFGQESLFTDNESIQLPISLPVGNWILAAKPAELATMPPLLLFLRGFGIAVSFIVSGLVFALFSSYRRIRYLALHDPLTGLANRRLFFEHVKQAVFSATRKQGRFAIVYLDLDNFKPINDTYGHKHGDHVLKEVALRMTEGLRHSDITARIGGDEFILLMQDTDKAEDIPSLVEKIAQLIRHPLTLDNGVTIQIQASIGASIYPDDGTTADELIRYADRRMYTAKSNKRK